MMNVNQTAPDKAILCIGASELQRPVLEAAKHSGAFLAISDKQPSSLIAEFADDYCEIDGKNIGKLLSYAESIHKRVPLSLVYSGSDFGLPAVAAISEKYKLPACSTYALNLSTNKAKAQEHLKRNGFFVPEHVISPHPTAPALNCPLVVKPIDGSGSMGVTIVSNPDEYPNAFLSAVGVSPSRTVLVEEWVAGLHIDVSGFIAGGRFFPGGILDRFFTAPPSCLPTHGTQPPKTVSGEQLNLIYTTLWEAALCLGIYDGPVKGDFILVDGKPCIIEITPRFHGDISTSHVAARAYGQSPVACWFDWVIRKRKPTCSFSLDHRCVAGWRAIVAPSLGSVRSIDFSRSNDKDHSRKQAIYIHRHVGFVVPSVTDNRAVIGFVTAEAENHDKLDEKLSAMAEGIRIEMG